LPDTVPGRFNSAVFVAEERLDAGFGAVQPGLADLLCRGALITPSVDCHGQGMTGPVRLSPPCALPDGLDSRLAVQAERNGEGIDQVQRNKGQGQGHVHY